MPYSPASVCDDDVAVNLARLAVYRFLAISLTDPRHGAWSRLAALREGDVLPQAAALLRQSQADAELGPAELAGEDLDPARALASLPEGQEALNAQYEATFGLLVSGRCPPYETEYVNSKFSFQRSNGLADVAGYYAAFGVGVAGARPERPDHITLELEFMALLVDLERRAMECGDASSIERRAICRDAQASFLREHLAWWAPAFAKLLRYEAGGEFYAAIGRLLAAFIPLERALLGVPIVAPVDSLEPPEPLETCEGCGLAG
ncbi:MAG: hypothetical protein DCC67_03250 [Planctomycetota bacterium]|nr:MAG: hypothetical protein DCC67_03250 [Planctomycetota bacterium]